MNARRVGVVSSDKMVVKPRELFKRIMERFDSLRAFIRQHPETVSLSTLSNWVKEWPKDKGWLALTAKISSVANALDCKIDDIAAPPRPQPVLLDSRYVLIAVLGGSSPKQVELDVRGEELFLTHGEGELQSLRGNVVTVGEHCLTGILSVHSPHVSHRAGELEPPPEEMTIQAQWEGDKIRGVWTARDGKGNFQTAHFEGVRQETSNRRGRRAACC
jgi:hypothetical protein